MKHLLHNRRAITSFVSLKTTIKNKTKEIKEYQQFRGIEFEEHIRKIIFDFNNKEKRINKLKRTYQKVCLSAGKPIETMLKEFLNHSKKYNEDDLV